MERRAAGRLIVVCGLPGSGKTTHARALAASEGAVRFAPDEWMEALSLGLWEEEARARIEALQWKLAQELLPLGVNVIIEWGTWGRSERDTLRLRAHELGARVELHYLSAPLDVLWERVRRRGMEDPPASREDLSRWATVIQVPDAEEMALFDRVVVIEAGSSQPEHPPQE
jgi:predicted kinase